MRLALLRNASLLYNRNLLRHFPSTTATRLFSSDENPNCPVPQKPGVDDVDNKEFKKRIESYFNGNEQALPSIMEAILQRKLSGKHDETDDDLLDELRNREPIDNVGDSEFESGFEDLHETDDEIDDLYNARDVVIKRKIENMREL